MARKTEPIGNGDQMGKVRLLLSYSGGAVPGLHRSSLFVGRSELPRPTTNAHIARQFSAARSNCQLADLPWEMQHLQMLDAGFLMLDGSDQRLNKLLALGAS